MPSRQSALLSVDYYWHLLQLKLTATGQLHFAGKKILSKLGYKSVLWKDIVGVYQDQAPEWLSSGILRIDEDLNINKLASSMSKLDQDCLPSRSAILKVSFCHFRGCFRLGKNLKRDYLKLFIAPISWF